MYRIMPAQQFDIPHGNRLPISAGSWRPTSFGAGGQIPPIGTADVHPLVPGLDLWDCWPLAHRDGRTAEVGGRQYWFFLSAPQFADPVERHAHARIRLLSRAGGHWRDHGNALPDGLCPGSREWAGSAVLDADGRTVTLWFTAAGYRGQHEPSFEQRLFVTRGTLDEAGIGSWSEPVEFLAADGTVYRRADDKVERAPGTLKAFRDPFYFRDPRTGVDHMVFTASAGWSDDPHNGMVGFATLTAGGWRLQIPLIDAIGVNNELERAQLHWRAGHYYAIWSTQSHTFATTGPVGPNGLYGMVASDLAGPWRPVNESGLIAANPADEPAQSYSWCLTGEDEVWSFVDYWGLAGRSLADHPELRRSQFGGTAAPVFRLSFAGETVRVV
ncbi:MAG TPA: glycoside hydrolase family 68 protein [Novosphingobium sp.]